MEYPTGIAIHQWPRDKLYREILCAPKGFVLVEHDFSGQEMRWMAEYSRDAAMLKLFTSQAPYDDAHSYMAARLTARTFENMIESLHAPDGSEILLQAKSDRNLGKFANLSLQYRTGVKKLRAKARIEYKIPMTEFEAERVSRTYKATFPGVPAYWVRQIATAKAQGYVESFAGKRYRFPPNSWEKKNQWASESTSINWPIQGVGGSQKALAMKYLKPYWEKVGGAFAWDLHDGIYCFLREDGAREQALEMQQILNNLPYGEEWGWEPTIPFPVDAKMGPNWGKLKGVV